MIKTLIDVFFIGSHIVSCIAAVLAVIGLIVWGLTLAPAWVLNTILVLIIIMWAGSLGTMIMPKQEVAEDE